VTYTRAAYLADVLRAAAPAAEWDAGGVDRGAELAGILIAAGLTDLSSLTLDRVEYSQGGGATWQDTDLGPMLVPVDLVTVTGLAFDYQGFKIGFLGTPDKRENRLIFEGSRFAWSAAGHGNVGYHVIPAPGGFAMAPYWGSSSDAAAIRGDALLIGALVVTFVMPAAGIAMGNMIGAAVIGPTMAAAYPALATAVGNFALATAFNGGDVKAAASMAALAYIGGVGGQFASNAALSATDTALVGKLAASATSAAITGSDVDKAVLSTLVFNGADVYDFVNKGPTMNFDDNSEPGGTDPFSFPPAPIADQFADQFADYWMLPPQNADEQFTIGPVQPPAPGNFSFNRDLSTAPIDSSLTIVRPPASQFTIAVEPPLAARNDPFSFGDTREVVNTVSVAAKAAVSLVGAYQALQSRGAVQINPYARSMTTHGPVAALDTGVIQSRDASGRIVNTRPPVGMPQSTIGGGVIVNNGDNTYTLVTSTGQSRIIRYGESTGSDSFFADLPWPLIFGGAGLLVAILK